MKDLTIESLAECLQKLHYYSTTPFYAITNKPTCIYVSPMFYKQAYLILNPWVLKRYTWLRKKR